jgi:hypothetical protein
MGDGRPPALEGFPCYPQDEGQSDDDYGNGGRGADDMVNTSDHDEIDTAGGGRGRGDLCIISVDTNPNARDTVGNGCNQVREVHYAD